MDTFDLTGTELAGFALKKRLGSGGMATVYYAENLLTPSIVRALKVIHPTLAVQQDFISRFTEEANSLERLTHPNVVRFHGLRKDGPHYTIELELLVGKSLHEILEGTEKGVPLEDAARWIYEAASGVAAAHALNMVHRDLKPENLFLTDDKTVKVLDFGIAKARDDAERATRLTQAGSVPGTADYLAPEVWDVGDAGPEADVYALGLTLMELLLGHHPFMPPGEPRPSRVQIMNAHINKGVPDLRETHGHLPGWVHEVLLKSTAQDPADRYASAADLARALEQGTRSSTESAPQQAEPAAAEEGPKSYTTLNLPTRATVEKEAAEASPESGRNMTPVFMGVGCAMVALVGVVLVGAGAAGSGMIASLFGGGGEMKPLSTVPPNPFVHIALPSKPVPLGLPNQQGVGFWPDARIASPTVAFAIQQHEITWAELDPWLAENPDHAFDQPPGGDGPQPSRDSLAASGVPWATADAYCHGLGSDVALPTEEQWEYAARGEILRPNAWGDRGTDPLRTNAFGGEDWAVKAVMISPQDRTPGAKDKAIYDLMGNVREWTADPYRVPTTGMTPPQAASATQTMRVIRGLPLKPHPKGETYERPRVGAAWREPLCGTGTCLTQPTLMGESMADALREVGFRCARDVLSEE